MYKYSDFLINVEENELMTTYDIMVYCPECFHDKDNKVDPTLCLPYENDLNNRRWFCHHCGFAGDLFKGKVKIPDEENLTKPFPYNISLNEERVNKSHTQQLPKSVIQNFESMGISKNTLDYFKVGMNKAYFNETEAFMTALSYPYIENKKVVNFVYFYKDFRSFEMGGVKTFFNFDAISNDHTYVVLNEIEAMTLHEAGYHNVISLFSGFEPLFHKQNMEMEFYLNQSLSFLAKYYEVISKIKKITIVMPNTELGQALSTELVRRFGKERCWTASPEKEDATLNQMWCSAKEHVHDIIQKAQAVPFSGIFEIDDIEDEFDNLYDNGLRRGYSIGFPSFDEYYSVVPGQWTVVTGIPGHGKSNFLDAIIVNLANLHDFRFGIFSPENQPIARHFASILEKKYGQPFDKGKVNRISYEQKEEGKKWLKKHFSVILPDENDSWSIEGILNLAKVLVYRKGIKGLILDPWNEIDHSRPNNQTETEYVSYVLTKLRQFARNFDVHVWLVAHPAKLYKDKDGNYPVPTPYDISGSAHYRNKADNAFTVYRHVGQEDQDISDIHIQKIRFKEVGKVGLVSIRYDYINGIFVDDIDQDKRRRALEDGEIVPTVKLKRYF